MSKRTAGATLRMEPSTASPTLLPTGAFWVTHAHLVAVTKNTWVASHAFTIMSKSKLFSSLTTGVRSAAHSRLSSRDFLDHVDELIAHWRRGMGDETKAAIIALAAYVRTKDHSTPE